MKIDDKALINVCRWAEHSGLDWNIAREVVMAYEAAKAPAAAQPVGCTTWEYFCDEAYFHQWAVRRHGSTEWGDCFHVPSSEEALALSGLLNDLSASSSEREAAQPDEPPKTRMFYPEAAKAYNTWVKIAGDNPIIMADASFETFLAGWQAAEKRSPVRESVDVAAISKALEFAQLRLHCAALDMKILGRPDLETGFGLDAREIFKVRKANGFITEIEAGKPDE